MGNLFVAFIATLFMLIGLFCIIEVATTGKNTGLLVLGGLILFIANILICYRRG